MTKKHKTLIVFIVFQIFILSKVYAQSNTFPSSGNVGIGTSSPSKSLDIRGANNMLQIWKGNGYAPLRFYSAGNGTHNNASIDISTYGWGGSEDLRFKIGNWGGSYYFKYGSKTGEYNAVRITRSGGGSGGVNAGAGIIDVYTLNQALGIRLHGNGNSWINTGNVGIGTTTPSHKLSVAGTINSEEIIVEENVGADFVFEASYDLRSLQDIEAFIKQNQHLPGIAPASQMIEEGVKVGELQMQLLQKIEELTLYVIEINKENKALVQTNHKLEQRIKQLEEHDK